MSIHIGRPFLNFPQENENETKIEETKKNHPTHDKFEVEMWAVRY